MRLPLFWRAMIAQSLLIGLALILSSYAMTSLNRLSALDGSILSVDSECLREEKQLLKIFLAQMRNSEKYLLLRDEAFQAGLAQSKEDFEHSLAHIAELIDSPREKELTAELTGLHERYHQQFALAEIGDAGSWDQSKKELSDGIFDRGNELVRICEQRIADKTVAAHDQAATAAAVMRWLTLSGIGGAVLLAFLHARGVSRPLKRLAREMRRVGRGEYPQSLRCSGPKEIDELAGTFNRMTEELAELDRLKSDFTAHVSHELRTPLTAIREGTALLLEEIPGPVTTRQREVLQVVSNHSERLYHSITSILDLSKMEAEMLDYDFLPCDFAALLQRTVAAVALLAENRGIVITADVEQQLPLLRLDERRIQQVVENLLSNALKFTPDGGRIEVNASVEGTGSDRHVTVRVHDNGEGIPAEDLERIFERFYQSQQRQGHYKPGTGLGLPIARHIVAAHGGKVWAQSPPGEGATFLFTLPLSPDNAPTEKN